MEEFNLILANKLQELRKEHGLKQDVLAKELKFTQQAYSKLERGASNFTPVILKRICNYFSVSATTFLNTGSQTKFDKSPQANNQNSFNNESKLVDELIKSKNEIIASQGETIKQLKEMVELLKRK
ncbi:MAG: helix-turn-helix domain-containing protein [Bacteroidota bacterium]|jgi:putative transcriptional regulator